MSNCLKDFLGGKSSSAQDPRFHSECSSVPKFRSCHSWSFVPRRIGTSFASLRDRRSHHSIAAQLSFNCHSIIVRLSLGMFGFFLSLGLSLSLFSTSSTAKSWYQALVFILDVGLLFRKSVGITKRLLGRGQDFLHNEGIVPV